MERIYIYLCWRLKKNRLLWHIGAHSARRTSESLRATSAGGLFGKIQIEGHTSHVWLCHSSQRGRWLAAINTKTQMPARDMGPPLTHTEALIVCVCVCGEEDDGMLWRTILRHARLQSASAVFQVPLWTNQSRQLERLDSHSADN